MIDILIATYNGDKYLRSQLDSLLQQTCPDWTALIHDDGSSDGTLEIIYEYCQKYPIKFRLIEDGVVLGSAKGNFFHLMECSSANYIMFCDQDDVWLPEKVERTYQEMKRCESEYSIAEPIVIHSDLKIVDADLNVIAESLFKFLRIPEKHSDIRALLVRNNVTGCTMMLNRSAVNVSLPADFAFIHDWWVAAMVMKAQGKIRLIQTPLMLYRQHEKNVIGAGKITLSRVIYRFFTCFRQNEIRKRVWLQAKAVDPSLTPMTFFVTRVLSYWKR